MSIESIKAEMRERAARAIASMVTEREGATKAEEALRITEETARALDVGIAAAEHACARKASSVGFGVDVQLAEGVVVHVTGCVEPVARDAPPPPTARMERPLPPSVAREVLVILEGLQGDVADCRAGVALLPADMESRFSRARALLQAFA